MIIHKLEIHFLCPISFAGGFQDSKIVTNKMTDKLTYDFIDTSSLSKSLILTVFKSEDTVCI